MHLLQSNFLHFFLAIGFKPKKKSTGREKRKSTKPKKGGGSSKRAYPKAALKKWPPGMSS
jgi:hypothetical protein